MIFTKSINTAHSTKVTAACWNLQSFVDCDTKLYSDAERGGSEEPRQAYWEYADDGDVATTKLCAEENLVSEVVDNQIAYFGAHRAAAGMTLPIIEHGKFSFQPCLLSESIIIPYSFCYQQVRSGDQ